MNIIPGILESNWSAVKEKAVLFSNKSAAGLVQIDICDGRFVPTVTWPLSADGVLDEQGLHQGAAVLREQGVLIEFDMMVRDPERILIQCLLSNPRRITIHFSSTDNLERCFAIMHGYQLDYPKFEYGIAVSISDDFDAYQKVLKRVHYVQVMGIEHIGQQGQVFNAAALDIVSRIHKYDAELPIQVDGGVGSTILKELQSRGVASVVVGSALFGTADPVLTRVELQNMLL